jgi:hypothetical protein
MRSQLVMLIAALGFATSATTVAAIPAAATAPSSDTSMPSQTGVWTTRSLQAFAPPYGAACGDAGYGMLRFVLLQLGARVSDLKIDRRSCYLDSPGQSVDATFSVLTPTDQSGRPVPDAVADAQWQTVELKVPVNFDSNHLVDRSGASLHDDIHDCAYLRYVTQKVLPLFSTREVKLIPTEVCNRHDVGLRAQVLKPTQQLDAAP